MSEQEAVSAASALTNEQVVAWVTQRAERLTKRLLTLGGSAVHDRIQHIAPTVRETLAYLDACEVRTGELEERVGEAIRATFGDDAYLAVQVQRFGLNGDAAPGDAEPKALAPSNDAARKRYNFTKKAKQKATGQLIAAGAHGDAALEGMYATLKGQYGEKSHAGLRACLAAARRKLRQQSAASGDGAAETAAPQATRKGSPLKKKRSKQQAKKRTKKRTRIKVSRS